MRKLLLPLLLLGVAGCKVEDETGREGGNGTLTSIDLFHGYYDVGPGYYFYVKFSARSGDTLHFEARARDGDGNVSYAFWTDSTNYAKWVANDSTAVLNGYRENVPTVSYTTPLDSNVYYVVLGNSSSITTKRFWVRAYIRGVR